jgi:arginine repressor
MSSIKEQKLYWQNEIIARLEKAGILKFLINEVADSLDYLNLYKVKNVYNGIDKLITTLKEMQTNYMLATIKKI